MALWARDCSSGGWDGGVEEGLFPQLGGMAGVYRGGGGKSVWRDRRGGLLLVETRG